MAASVRNALGPTSNYHTPGRSNRNAVSCGRWPGNPAAKGRGQPRGYERQKLTMIGTSEVTAWLARAPAAGPGAAVAVQPGGRRPPHLRGPAEPLEQPDDRRADIDLTRTDAMPGTSRIGVMHVVPALAERQQRERPQVGCPVEAARAERAAAEHVTQRVDTPGDVLQQAMRTSRPRPARRAPPAGCRRSPSPGRTGARERRRTMPGMPPIPPASPGRPSCRARTGVPGSDRPGTSSRGGRGRARAAGRPGRSVPVGRVRITWPVGEGVMPPVGSNPGDHAPRSSSSRRRPAPPGARRRPKLRWVKHRWNPAVTPIPVTR